MKASLKTVPKKVLHFFQNHFYLTLGLVAGIWFLSAGQPDHSLPHPELSSYHRGDVSEMAMLEDSAPTAPVMMKSMARGIGGGGMIPEVSADFAPDQKDQKLIKNASLTVEVEDTESGKTEVESKVKALGGFITNLRSWETRPGILAYSLTLRIPVDKLDTALAQITELGSKKAENFSVRDITAQYTDNESRIKNLEVRRDRLREMMDRKTENLGDVLQIDRELSSVQQQIENLERTQRKNDNDIEYSTLTLSLQPEPQIGDIQNPEWSVKRSWRSAVNDLLGSIRHIADRAIMALVYAPVWIPILLVLWFVKRRFFRK